MNLSSATFQALLHDYLLLFAMVNVVGNLPLFASMTAGLTVPERHRAYRVAVATAALIVLAFAFLGDFMLREVFQVRTCAMMIAGGVVVFSVATRGILSQASAPAPETPEKRDHMAVVPMGFPFLAGPGTIITTILLMQSQGSLRIGLVAVLVYLTVLPVLFLSGYVEKVIGRIGVLVVPRILYIFIAAKAVSFVLDGFTECLGWSS